MTVICIIFGCLCLLLAFVEPRRNGTIKFEERAESAQWVIAAALFFLVAK